MAYPTDLDSYTAPSGTSLLSSPDHADLHARGGSAIISLETKLGLSAGSPVVDKILVGSGNGTSAWGTTWNNANLGTPTIGTINTPGTATPLSFGGGLVTKVVTLTDAPAGTITPNAAGGQTFSLIIGTTAGNRTLAMPANANDGAFLLYRIQQNATSNGTVLWATGYKFSGGTANTFTLGTTASSWNYYSFRYNVSGTTCDDQGSVKDIA